MAERRRMADALTPEQTAFLKAENPEVRESAEEQPAVPAPPPANKARITLTVRLEPDVAAALAQAAATRKMQQRLPYTQQDIVGEALKQWLQAAGFWVET
jgi:hypothetical protein